LFYDREDGNARRLFRALEEFCREIFPGWRRWRS